MIAKPTKYDKIFKVNVVLTSYEKRTIDEYADEIGIRASTIGRWRKEYQRFGTGSFPGSGYPRIHPEKKKSFELEKEYKDSKLRLEILKKGTPYLFKDKLTIYQFIYSNEKNYSITKMCKVLEVGIGRYIR